MRNQYGFMSPTHQVTTFLIVIIASYLFFALLGNTAFGSMLYSYLMLDPDRAVYSYEVWRMLTYAFLHDPSSPFHVILNALMLYMLGPQLEDRWGGKRFVIFVFTAILAGGVLVCASFLLGMSRAIVIGFSSATIGLLIAWGLTFSRQQMYVFGILPLSGIQMVYLTIGLEVIYAVGSNTVSSAAHFGGIITGIIFTLGLYKPERLKQYWRQYKRKNLK